MHRAINDMVFKYIFGSEERRELLRAFVNLVLERAGLPLASTISLKTPFLLKQFVKDKDSVLDLRAEDEKGRVFNLEIQIAKHPGFAERALYYWSRIYGSQMLEGDEYRDLKPVVTIWIMDFVLMPDRRHLPKLFRPVDVLAGAGTRSAERTLSEQMNILLLELPLLPPARNCGELEKWLTLMQVEGEDEAMSRSLAETDRLLAEFDSAYKKFMADDELRETYEGRLKWRLEQNTLRNVAWEEGLAEGKAEGKAEVALRMRSLGLPIETIAATTGLTQDDIAKLS